MKGNSAVLLILKGQIFRKVQKTNKKLLAWCVRSVVCHLLIKVTIIKRTNFPRALQTSFLYITTFIRTDGASQGYPSS